MNKELVLDTFNESYEPTIKLNPPVPEAELVDTTNIVEMCKLARRKSSATSDGPKGDWRKDKNNIVFLLFLYFLQGVPIGLASCLPIILSARKASYTDLGVYSFTFMPFSLKVFWAPIIDSVFIRRFGRRKSWIIPTQFFIGLFLLSFASLTQDIVETAGEPGRMTSGIYYLTIIFTSLIFLASAQDVTVDGWALSMLSEENVGWAAITNQVGQTGGWIIGNALLLVFESAEFCNKHFRPILGLPPQNIGFVTIFRFMVFFGVLFLISTILITIFAKEKNEKNIEKLSIWRTYWMVYKMLRLRPVQIMIVICLTARIGLASDGLTSFKLIEFGVPKEHIGLIGMLLAILDIVAPIVISKFIRHQSPLNLQIFSYPVKLIWLILLALLVFVTSYLKNEDGSFPWYYYLALAILFTGNAILYLTINISHQVFVSQICDPAIGGTYMTFMNTISNFGYMWPGTVAFFVIDYTTKLCSFKNFKSLGERNITSLTNLTYNLYNASSENSYACMNSTENEICTKSGGECVISFDLYYVVVVVCIAFGFAWIAFMARQMRALQHLPRVNYRVVKPNVNTSET